MHRFLVSGVIACALAVGLCAAQPPNNHNPDTGELAKGNTAFAVDLYQNLSKNDGNLFFSPYSISNALAMTYAGARGQTATDMAKTLRFPFDGQRLHPAFGDLINQLNRPAEKRQYKLAVANRLWGQKGFGFAPEFLKLSADAYGAGLQEVDFINAANEARITINDWVAKETQDRIKDLLARGDVNSRTRLVLTNAIYFKAAWASAFAEAATKKEDFKTGDGKKAKVDMMHAHRSGMLVETDAFQMLEIPYERYELSMLVLLPRKVDGLPALEKQLTGDNLAAWTQKLKEYEVAVGMPKVTYTSEFSLEKVLGDMGMAIAFDKDRADFSGMASRKELFISKVIHKAFVAVDEKGSEAAAATAVAMATPTSIRTPVALPKATFTADHPFVFLIRDNRTGSVLFMGRFVDP